MAYIEEDKFENKSYVAERVFSEFFVLSSEPNFKNRIISITNNFNISNINFLFLDDFQLNTVFTISGKYNSIIFGDNIIKHIPRETSNLVDPTITTTNFSHINKFTRRVIEYIPQIDPIYITFRINYEEILDDIGPAQLKHLFLHPQEVFNHYDSGRELFLEYV